MTVPEFKTAQQLLDESRIQQPLPEAPKTVEISLPSTTLAAKVSGLSDDEVEVLRKTICKDLTNEELLLYLVRCHRKRLDPFDQAYVFVHMLEDGKTRDMSQGFVMGTKIDGMRALSRRSGTFGGILVELLKDGQENVFGARATVWRTDVERPFVEEALFKEYRKGRMWDRMPETMIRKVAESKALRAAFPNELAGIYEPAELE